MKKKLGYVLGIIVSGFLLGGCCTTHHASSWEYKVVFQQSSGVQSQEALLNTMAKEGWIFVQAGADYQLFYFKRAKR